MEAKTALSRGMRHHCGSNNLLSGVGGSLEVNVRPRCQSLTA
jgi:hypothetical protein